MQKLEQVPAIIHAHTDVGGGRYSTGELAAMAREAGIRAVLTTDKADRVWSWGIPPFQGVARISVRNDSVEMSSMGDYLARFPEARKSEPGMLIVPGLEVSPYYRWQGDPRANNLELRDWGREMLVFGLRKTEDWQGLPFTGNPRAARFTPASVAELALCAALLAAAAVLFFLKQDRSFKIGLWRKQKVRYHVHPFRPFGWFLFAVAIVVAAAAYPFRSFPFSPYGTDAGAAPYRDFIDYVESRGGIAVWSHPEVYGDLTYRKDYFMPGWLARTPFVPRDLQVVLRVRPHPELLAETPGFTAFAALYEGDRKMTAPGGVWDRALAGYAAGRARRPYWAVGELDYYGTEKDKPIDHVQTVFLVDEFSEKGLFEAFRAGRMYAVMAGGGAQLRLSDYFIESVAKDGPEPAFSGGEICPGAVAHVYAGIDSVPRPGLAVRARLIKNGEVVRTVEGATPLNIGFFSPPPQSGKADFYRIDVSGADSPARLISNPIFVRRDCGK